MLPRPWLKLAAAVWEPITNKVLVPAKVMAEDKTEATGTAEETATVEAMAEVTTTVAEELVNEVVEADRAERPNSPLIPCLPLLRLRRTTTARSPLPPLSTRRTYTPLLPPPPRSPLPMLVLPKEKARSCRPQLRQVTFSLHCPRPRQAIGFETEGACDADVPPVA